MMLILVITFSAIPLSLQQLHLQNAFAQDDSQTDTEQRLRQKNTGSGESTNFNCAENMITSASDSIECIPSGPPPPTGAFTISGQGSRLDSFICNGISLPSVQPEAIIISAEGQEDGTVTGFIAFSIGLGITFPVTGGTTDGNTFSLTGETGPGLICGGEVQQFTVSGECGTGVIITYEEPDASGTFTGNVECTLV